LGECADVERRNLMHPALNHVKLLCRAYKISLSPLRSFPARSIEMTLLGIFLAS